MDIQNRWLKRRSSLPYGDLSRYCGCLYEPGVKKHSVTGKPATLELGICAAIGHRLALFLIYLVSCGGDDAFYAIFPLLPTADGGGICLTSRVFHDRPATIAAPCISA